MRKSRKITNPVKRRIMPRKQPLEKIGWKRTPAGRWIDPESQRSYTIVEAWDIVKDRGQDAYCSN